MAEPGWNLLNWLEISTNGCKLLSMKVNRWTVIGKKKAGNDWKLLEFDGNCLKFLAIYKHFFK